MLFAKSQGRSGNTFKFPDVPVHDPVMIRQDSTYYVFCTGRGVTMLSSNDRLNWKREKPVFDSAAAWATAAVPGFRNHVWAPDISLYKGKYYLFYSVSSFGKNTSCIGVAVNETLHQEDAGYQWKDLGKVLCSLQGTDRYNAIDPNLVLDEKGRPWLSFGSFWEGIELVQLKADLSAPETGSRLINIAGRGKRIPGADTSNSSAIEAPFIYTRGGYYYLFVSFDMCCKGVNSTYRIMVGRSRKVTGPYVDKAGRPMTSGWAEQVLRGNERWSGVGHNAVVTLDGADYLVFHAYDKMDAGKSKLRMEKLSWPEGWPVSEF